MVAKQSKMMDSWCRCRCSNSWTRSSIWVQ